MTRLGSSPEMIQRTLKGVPLSIRMLATAVVSFAVFACLVFLRGGESKGNEALFGGRELSQQEMDAVEIAFSKSGLNGWQREKNQITFPAKERHRYLAALDGTAALPVSLRSRVESALNESSFFETHSQRQARQLHAKERDLGNKLAAFDDIRWASVEHDQGERNGFNGTRSQSASVVVCPQGDHPLPLARIETIREFIRGSYADMQSRNVVVIDTNADPAKCHPGNPLSSLKIEHQARLEQEVLELLNGYADARVRAYVELSVDPNQTLAPPQTTPPIEPIRQQHSTDDAADQQCESGLLDQVLGNITRVRGSRAKRLAILDDSMMNPNLAILNRAKIKAVRLTIGLPFGANPNPGNRESSTAKPPSVESLNSIDATTKAHILTAVRPAILARFESEPPADTNAISIELYHFPDAAEVAITPASNNDELAANSWLTWLTPQTALASLVTLVVAILLATSIQSKRNTAERLPHEVTQGTPISNDIDRDIDQDLTKLVEHNPDRAVAVIQAWLTEAA